ncbi:MAG TPA: hypothetical protein ENL43_02535 [candidate division WOR-3 bacterium]|uniref:Uncharacterized protein n=1 Tax=candidate division WOR-3 bacterium TaxID=2052148 RepID=A0A7V5HP04_UNCW3|nr:hypothetical protein [candidate division WOR-3 bacterium]
MVYTKIDFYFHTLLLVYWMLITYSDLILLEILDFRYHLSLLVHFYDKITPLTCQYFEIHGLWVNN